MTVNNHKFWLNWWDNLKNINRSLHVFALLWFYFSIFPSWKRYLCFSPFIFKGNTQHRAKKRTIHVTLCPSNQAWLCSLSFSFSLNADRGMVKFMATLGPISSSSKQRSAEHVSFIHICDPCKIATTYVGRHQVGQWLCVSKLDMIKRVKSVDLNPHNLHFWVG